MSAVSCAKTKVNPMKHIVDGDITLAQLGEYDRTVRVRRRCGLMSNYSNYFVHLLLLSRIAVLC